MTVSIVIPTNRIGGLDVLFASLEQQTCKDFELILVDNIYEYRRDLVAERIKEASFLVKHIPPRDNPFPDVCYCRTMNTGIEHADGAILLYQCDYIALAPDCVETHREFQERQGGPFFCDFAYTEFPEPLCPRYCHDTGPEVDGDKFTAELNAVTERYAEDLDAGKLDEFMWSIWAETPDPWSLEVKADHYKLAVRGGEDAAAAETHFDDYNHCCFKNESFPLDLLLKMNGHDERYDLSHAWQDQEFSYRLRAMGVPWHHAPHGKGEARCVDPRASHWYDGWLNIKRLKAPWKYNMALCDCIHVPTAEPVNPGFSLRQRREDRRPDYEWT